MFFDTLELEASCVGACGLAPVIEVGEKVYGRLTPDRVKDVLAEYK